MTAQLIGHDHTRTGHPSIMNQDGTICYHMTASTRVKGRKNLVWMGWNDTCVAEARCADTWTRHGRHLLPQKCGQSLVFWVANLVSISATETVNIHCSLNVIYNIVSNFDMSSSRKWRCFPSLPSSLKLKSVISGNRIRSVFPNRSVFQNSNALME